MPRGCLFAHAEPYLGPRASQTYSLALVCLAQEAALFYLFVGNPWIFARPWRDFQAAFSHVLPQHQMHRVQWRRTRIWTRLKMSSNSSSVIWFTTLSSTNLKVAKARAGSWQMCFHADKKCLELLNPETGTSIDRHCGRISAINKNGWNKQLVII